MQRAPLVDAALGVETPQRMLCCRDTRIVGLLQSGIFVQPGRVGFCSLPDVHVPKERETPRLDDKTGVLWAAGRIRETVPEFQPLVHLSLPGPWRCCCMPVNCEHNDGHAATSPRPRYFQEAGEQEAGIPAPFSRIRPAARERRFCHPGGAFRVPWVRVRRARTETRHARLDENPRTLTIRRSGYRAAQHIALQLPGRHRPTEPIASEPRGYRPPGRPRRQTGRSTVRGSASQHLLDSGRKTLATPL